MRVVGSADEVIEDLKGGNKRFLSGRSIQSNDLSLQKLKNFAETGQIPKAIILCCSDSRAPVEMIFDQDIGDLFVIRVAGNVVAPSLVGSVEFAVSAFGTPLVIVMGHSNCGAIKATLDHIIHTELIASENIHDIVSRIKPHVFTITQIPSLSYEEKLEACAQANVLASVNQLMHASRFIEDQVQKERLKIVGAMLDLASGEVAFLN
ncbi:MAG: carbonic anhydrase [Pseudobdellovibrionaceae bacterium]